MKLLKNDDLNNLPLLFSTDQKHGFEVTSFSSGILAILSIANFATYIIIANISRSKCVLFEQDIEIISI